MPKKRKDHLKNVLNTGEAELKNGLYQYRYTDSNGKRHAIYAKTLNQLRQKEAEAAKYSAENYSLANITVLELVKRYLQLKQSQRYNTKVCYTTALHIVEKEPFCQRKIKDVRMSDAKLWYIQMQNEGKHYSTICHVHSIVRPAFRVAYEEEVVRRNPFDFKVTDAIVNDIVHRTALTEEQLTSWLNFIKDDPECKQYYDEIVVMAETGLRISEFCGLTKKDLDFENKFINVDHQLCKDYYEKGKYFVEKTKTKSGCRKVPMTPVCEEALQNILKNRPKVKVERIVDGYSGFIFLTRKGEPKVAHHIRYDIECAKKGYDEKYPNNDFPPLTPHVLRHTFCTNMAKAGIDLKALQYIMGHSNAGVTMNVYAHVNFQHAEEAMRKVLAK